MCPWEEVHSSSRGLLEVSGRNGRAVPWRCLADINDSSLAFSFVQGPVRRTSTASATRPGGQGGVGSRPSSLSRMPSV